jgi:hypothetical protein
LLTSGTVLVNRQQEDSNALLTTIAEQQILTNKVQRDLLAGNLNVMTTADSYTASEATGWGGSAAHCGVQPMIMKLLLILATLVGLLGSLYLEVHERNHGVLDRVKPQQVPEMHSAETIRQYRQ